MSYRMTGSSEWSGPSRSDIDCARTYGAEARFHHFDREWGEVQAALAAGWIRVRGNTDAEWTVIEPEVHAGWQSAAIPGN